jgi:uncharacterized protein HemX
MDWTPIIAAIIAGVLSGGGVVWFTFRAQNRKTEAEARKAEAEAENTDRLGEIQQAQAIIGMWKELYAQLEKRVADLETVDKEKQTRIDDLEEEIQELRDWIEQQGLQPPPRKRKQRAGHG